MNYTDSGVDVTAGYKAVELMKTHVAKTLNPFVLTGLGGFGGLFELPPGYQNPVLVSGTDGVGTKLKIAFALDRHDTIGIDCVAMCVNDIVACGAKPLFFLDYIANGKTDPEKISDIIKGVSDGCIQAGCALVGGETAEMPGFYEDGEYDMAGFAVGIVEKSKIIDKETQKAGDVIIAIPSSGVHSNGFSLVRKVFSISDSNLKRYISELGQTLGECLLTPTKIYVNDILSLLEKVNIKGVAHITGGGFYENIPRTIKTGLTAEIERAAVKSPVIFDLIAKSGDVSEKDMFGTFNMGVGMVVVLDKKDADVALSVIKNSYVLGELTEGDELTIC
ncbi:MAG: phosphoribosylformylglycinamidine cyclo-ligase [Ruminococcus sp.]|jgi:phosphoribosylformylglycinamidine cyclo-ligase|nr:phosphoribosylformylglycinamidine cyclo-ligase [Ruminococcus sp.]